VLVILALALVLAALTLAALSVGEVLLCAERLLWALTTKINPMEATAVKATNDLFMLFSLNAREVRLKCRHSLVRRDYAGQESFSTKRTQST
jgi:hypothetical protein